MPAELLTALGTKLLLVRLALLRVGGQKRLPKSLPQITKPSNSTETNREEHKTGNLFRNTAVGQHVSADRPGSFSCSLILRKINSEIVLRACERRACCCWRLVVGNVAVAPIVLSVPVDVAFLIRSQC